MDWDDFEYRASVAVPNQPLKPKRCWIGVLLHDKDPRHPFSELDFIWMIGHGKITVEKIWQTYEARQGISDFHIVARSGVLDTKLALKEIMEPASELIAFRAVRAAQLSPESEISRAPLTTLQTPNGTSNPVATPSPVAPLTNRIKSEPRGFILPNGPTAAAPPVPPAASRQTGIKTESPRPSLQEATSTQTAPLGRNLSTIQPSETLGLSVQATPTRPDSPPTAAQLAGNAFTHDNATVPVVSARFDVNTSAPPADCDRFSMVFKHAVQPPQQASVPPGAPRPGEANSSDTLQLPSPKQEHQSYSPPREPYVPPVFHNEIQEPLQPFDPDNFFNREPSPLGESQDEAKPTDRAIREIIKNEDPVVLEVAVDKALKILDGFKQVFVQHVASSPDAQAWIQSIDKLCPQAKRKRTVVGVVGNTGAGKSSVINAMLDEERLVPTNCMRACTAVVTEMSWNDSNDPCSKYRAEIEFITRADWEKEVSTLMKEFLTENGTVSRDVSNQDSDAGIAWAKFHAVYPKIARDALDGCTMANLMAERRLDVLGTTKKINTAQANRFYYELQKYVDSKEKVTKRDKDKDKEKQKKPFEMEYWPLIKVVKIYTRAPALSTGAVIVDLPGVHDSNAARAAVAQGYIKQCTGLWIVAPITRAVDDKAAKTLLGDSFKTQLKYDGGFSSVTFICSKTDDISITEAIDTLDLEEEVESFYKQERELKKEIEDTQSKFDDLEETRQVYLLAQREYAGEIETWEDLQEQMDDGKEVFAPASKPSKRKKAASTKKSRKKRQAHDDDSDFIASDDDEEEETEEEEDDDDEGVEAPREPLTEEDIKTKLKDLRDSRKNARRAMLEIKPKIEELKHLILDAQAKLKAIKAEISRICISGRNEYSKRAIQQDFAAGIKELDQENAAEEDEDNFNPDEEQRDYDEVAKALPVFCVSSRAYQKMCGRLLKDDAVPGFNTPEETEMPQLQAHCKKLTEAGRIQSTRAFLFSLCQQLTTFTLWASNDGSGVKTTDDDKCKQHKYVERRLGELEKGLESAVEACLNVLKRELNDQIFDKYPDLIQDAINAAPETASKWGLHRADGGLAWGTYKAVVRRDGAYQSHTAGHRDFNSELVDPIVKKLATSWERAFQNRLPKAFATFISDSGKILHKFHEAVEIRARENGVGLASLSTLKTQIYTYEVMFRELSQVLIGSMTNLQREANRDFTPTIANIMHTVYETCTEEHGKGSFMRMKAHMAAYVERARHSMFNEATLTVKRRLDHMCKRLQEEMEERADEIYIKMKADYMQVFGGVQVNTDAVVSREERAMRADIMALLRAVNSHFEPISMGVLPNAADDDVHGSAEEAAAADDDESVAFESVNESAHEDSTADPSEDAVMQDSTMQDNNKSGTVGQSPHVGKKSKLPTPLSNDVSDDGL
ncbi:hypothetical protein N0V86_005571 [Didymella sp. IMI 355093]|nr:hypothetical protein N0V86_005571 [Didymella sp. IMI 355093]